MHILIPEVANLFHLRGGRFVEVEGLSPGYVFGGVGKQKLILASEGVAFTSEGKIRT